MSTAIYEERQAVQAERERYRATARAMVSNIGGTVDHHAFVHPTDDGAFVEVVLWVPKNSGQAKGSDAGSQPSSQRR